VPQPHGVKDDTPLSTHGPWLEIINLQRFREGSPSQIGTPRTHSPRATVLPHDLWFERHRSPGRGERHHFRTSAARGSACNGLFGLNRDPVGMQPNRQSNHSREGTGLIVSTISRP